MSAASATSASRSPARTNPPRVMRRVARCVVVAAIVFVSLALAWPTVRPAYDRGFRAACNVMFRHFAPQGDTHFVVNPKYGETAIRLHKGDVRARRNVLIETWRWCWQPLAIVVALALATPISAKRRLAAALWGAIAVHLWIAARIALRLLYKYSSAGEVQQIDLGEMGFALVEFLDRTLVDSLDLFAVPLLIWIAVTFRRGDWAILLGAAQAVELPNRERQQAPGPDAPTVRRPRRG